MRKIKLRRKLLIAVLVVVLALGYLGYKGFTSAATYYYSVDEFLARKSSFVNEIVRVSGTVAPGSIQQNGLTLRFDVADGQQSLPVVYEGAPPDTFKAGGDITIEGKLNSSGTFVAKTLMPKCPAKYVPV